MIIGIAGKAQSGKDTACKIIQAISVYEKNENIEQPLVEFIKDVLNNPNRLGVCKPIWRKHSFAETLKECAALILDCDIEDFESINYKNSPTNLCLLNKEGNSMTNREFLQLLGTEVGRAIDKDLWVKVLLHKYLCALDDSSYEETVQWIIPDVRFPNEEAAIHLENGIVWKIIRNVNEGGTHESEQHFDEINANLTIENNGTIDEFINKVIEAYNKTKLYNI